MIVFIEFFGVVLYFAAPIMLAALGGMICERSGVVNIALEGFMCIGAFIAAVLQFFLYPVVGPFAWVAGAIAASLGGVLFAKIHAYSCVSMSGDQTVAGFGMNYLTLGATVFFSQIIFKAERTGTFQMGMIKSFLGFYPSVGIEIAAVLIVWFFLYKKRFGLRLRACGEHPQAAAAAGLKVLKIRTQAVLISGLLSGLAGACLVLTETTQYSSLTVNGQGFIALSAVAFGKWKPKGIMGASLVFGGAQALALRSSGISALKDLPSEVFSMAPYLLTILAMVLVARGRDTAPRALGEVYDASKR